MGCTDEGDERLPTGRGMTAAFLDPKEFAAPSRAYEVLPLGIIDESHNQAG